MNTTLVVLVVEIAIVLFAIVGVLFFLRWKRKKEKTSQIEELLDNVTSQAEVREAALIEHLAKKFSIDKKKATKISHELVEAEKQFLQQFLKQQLELAPVTGFYENLCGLLDQYLSLIPTNSTKKVKPIEKKVVKKEVTTKKKAPPVTTDTNDLGLEQMDVDEGEPDWGDAFAESGDVVDEATQAGYESELK